MKLLIQFENSLHFFLTKAYQAKFCQMGTIAYVTDRRASVKDIIESFGIPHTEVGQILYNGAPLDFLTIPEKDGRLFVSGILPPFDIRTPSLLRPSVIDQIRFIADVNVMKLGRMMMLLGFDVVCNPDVDDSTIANMASEQQRIVLTRDTRLLMRKKVVFARRIREQMPHQQLLEVVSFFGLKEQCRFFSRCSYCNISLIRVVKAKVLHLLEPKTKKYYHRFFQCPKCGKVYWKGSHYLHLMNIFKNLGLSINS